MSPLRVTRAFSTLSAFLDPSTAEDSRTVQLDVRGTGSTQVKRETGASWRDPPWGGNAFKLQRKEILQK